MNNRTRFKLRFGPYLAPPVTYGEIVTCEVRGDVVVVGMSEAASPGPSEGRRAASRSSCSAGQLNRVGRDVMASST
jgi:hypothetical protein